MPVNLIMDTRCDPESLAEAARVVPADFVGAWPGHLGSGWRRFWWIAGECAVDHVNFTFDDRERASNLSRA
jgi:hypothetical protein